MLMKEFSIKDIGNDFTEISFEGNKETPTFSRKGRYGKQLKHPCFFITINKTSFIEISLIFALPLKFRCFSR